ncbi:MAG: amidohydrolase [Mesorhizobium sp.]|uniref:amidohydrolase n=1 Tax=Mesorhizobium sp. TaxID=1871066 RepID=UPI001216E263|nr:amidohydrolase [Mesorhizobium sp.]TIR52794.1 MAG: amidohydrolase [Mesorhizobium sp.]
MSGADERGTKSRLAAIAAEATIWRRHLHANPELDFRLFRTAEFVAAKLQEFGVDQLEEGIAGTGIIAIIEGELGPGPTIGLRADMDALPIQEASGKPWASTIDGQMHACGHDGHTAMLLGAAKHLAAQRRFRGKVALIFQPAEEVEFPSGAYKMVREHNVLERFGISEVYGMHTNPGMDLGKFGIRDGALMASQDDFDIVVKGKGGHAARPHETVDPVVIAAQIIIGLQTLVSRNTSALDSLVISVTKLKGADAHNVVPDHVELSGTVRTLSPTLRDFAERRIPEVASGIAAAHGATVEHKYYKSVPVTFNHSAQAHKAVAAAQQVVGAAAVDLNIPLRMGAEDFAYMLEDKPGAFIFIGNGKTAMVHNPAFDFDDKAIVFGIEYWIEIVQQTLG